MQAMEPVRPLPAESLRRVCDPATLEFETTSELPCLSEVLGQPRAVAALEFGIGIACHGFNLFALGQPGSGRTTLIRDYLERQAARQPVPPDLCYVNNFTDARRPSPLLLPAGKGVEFKRDIEDLIEELRTVIPRDLEAEDYTRRRDRIVEEVETQRRQEIESMEQMASRAGFQLLKGPGGLLLVPSIAGKIITEEDLAKLSEEEKAKVGRAREKLQREIEQRVRALREIEKNAREKLKALDTDTVAFSTRHAIEDLREKYADQPGVLVYLDALQADVVSRLDDFRKGKEKEADVPQPPAPFPTPAEKPFVRYMVNVLVDNGALNGAPVVVETNPTYHNLTGRIEHQAAWGGVTTDHTMIKPGALHRAQGGYLLIPARECLMNPFAWEGLKRALKDRAVQIEELGTQLSLVSTVTLAPAPVPLNVKVVLIGAPMVYYLLHAYDEDFQKLFKVKSDFATRMDRTPEAERSYALFVNTIVQQEKTLPFDRGAVARIIEYGSRAAEDQGQLSTRFGDIADLIREASHRAANNSHQAVTASDVRAAEQARRFRQNLLEQRLQESILQGTILIDTAGSAVGRINGLTLLGLGDYSFGMPARLTATVAPGRGGVVSIEREVELSGPIHGKGVLILGGYLLHKYGHKGPLTLSASLVFEQSYSMIEGDSASLAELCVLLSALSGVALRQDVAVTGSINQHGLVQAIGGPSEKIEGFFDICRGRGMSGTQGVLIPASNQRHLMLRDDVVDAVRAGQFNIWTAETVDEALQLLTGEPPDAVHDAVLAKLDEYAKTIKALAAEEKKIGGFHEPPQFHRGIGVCERALGPGGRRGAGPRFSRR
jgi:lon-related putative ATP-dependent protease